ncbi:hypothetical protein A6V39_01320 [Candidatus Mycoplasma haematobovis]|uniref:Lipoprotein n=1 Tax=Candidatus Mycoplasma haematobovis TaxID=432608 RepID=A0A1A9QEY2_9MOLU|nr:hypothetical protein [Candidatus Mycoplasma haematobovis]OAL10694.1 hypothetical protein A6V39_01320 [Candidatus Mycoplasma haematobovis]
MPSLAKIGVVVLSIGSCTAAGCIGSIYLSGTPIKDLINEEYEYILLDTTGDKDSTSWDANWTSYKKDNTDKDSNKDTFKLEGWTKGSQANLVNKLKSKCQQLAASKVSNKQDSLYSKVTSYCARRVTVADEIEKLKLSTKILDTSERNGQNEGIWDNRVSGKATLQSELKTLNIDFNSANKSTMKTKCNEAKTKKKGEKGYQDTLNAYKRVCIKQSDE